MKHVLQFQNAKTFPRVYMQYKSILIKKKKEIHDLDTQKTNVKVLPTFLTLLIPFFCSPTCKSQQSISLLQMSQKCKKELKIKYKQKAGCGGTCVMPALETVKKTKSSRSFLSIMLKTNLGYRDPVSNTITPMHTGSENIPRNVSSQKT